MQREFAKENEIAETSYGVFEQGGDDALCLLMIIAHKVLCDRHHYIECLESLKLDDDGDVEDCLETVKRW